MKLVCISDTHRAHLDYTEILKDLGGDVLIHAGDSGCHDEKTSSTFMTWAQKVSSGFQYGGLFTFGNHDTFPVDPDNLQAMKDLAGARVQLLINESVQVEGVKFWVSPYSLPYGRTFSAFTLPEAELRKLYSQIPDNTEIIISHVPPFGILDNGHGSEALIERIEQLQPKLVIFGHIHERHGVLVRDGITYVNAASIGTVTEGPWLPLVIEYKDGAVTFDSPEQMSVT
jgi:Icc-related predicted phosphoesterase